MEIISLVIFLLITLALGYQLYSIYCTQRLFGERPKKERTTNDALPPVSIIKPVAGMEEGYRENFISFCNQDYPEYEIVFALSDPSDPVVPLLEELRKEFGDKKIRWVLAEDNPGPNYKVGNLIRALQAVRHEVLLFNDSDMRVGPNYLREVVGAFLPEGAGLVTCLYRSTHIRNIPTALHALSLQAGFVPNVAVGRQLEGLSYAFGSTICTSREVLSSCGGLEPLLEYLADDYQMGNRVRRGGYGVVLSPFLIDDFGGQRSFKEYVIHQLRWAITQRACRPGGYFASIITHATFLGFVVLAIERFSSFGWLVFLDICALRILSTAWLNRKVFHNGEIERYIWLVPVNDLLNAGVWFLSLFSRTVQWRKRRFRVLAGGKMVELARKVKPMTRKMSFSEMAVGGFKFSRYLVAGGLFNINLEVTKRCNARCDFCDYWQEQPPEELDDYVDVVKKLRPLSVSLTGGEPLLRRDLSKVIASLRSNFGFLFLSLVTNGSLLTLERGMELWNSGLDDMSISLDYPDQRHDLERGIPGLAAHIMSVAPELVAGGVNLCFNIVLKRENFREVPGLVRLAGELGVKTSISSYNSWRIGNHNHVIPEEDLQDLKEVVGELIAIRKTGGLLTTGEYYLENIPAFFTQKGMLGCTAGLNWVQVTPDGMLKRCSDHPVAGNYREWVPGFFPPTTCDRCWYSCRGAAQEPWTHRRFFEMAKEALGWGKTSGREDL